MLKGVDWQLFIAEVILDLPNLPNPCPTDEQTADEKLLTLSKNDQRQSYYAVRGARFVFALKLFALLQSSRDTFDPTLPNICDDFTSMTWWKSSLLNP